MRQIKITEKKTNRTQNMNRYFDEVNRQPLLSVDEETETAILAREGNKAAIDKLVNANLRFVISVAKVYSNGNMSKLEDLINEGNMGLVEAAKTFDPSTGFKFISYAVWQIRKYMLQYLTNNSRNVRIPSNKAQAIYKLRSIESNLSHELDRDPTMEEIYEGWCKYKQYSPSESERVKQIREFQKALNADYRPTSLEGDPDANDDDRSYVPIRTINGDPTGADGDFIKEDRNALLLKVLDKIPHMYKKIIMWKLGIGCYEKSIGEISHDLEISKESVRVRYNNGIKMLRKKMRSLNIDMTVDL